MTLSDMSDSCLLQSFSSNSTFIMLHIYMRWMLTTWQSMSCLISKLFDYTCMFSIGCKHILLIT
jgi:hypothetical protein